MLHNWCSLIQGRTVDGGGGPLTLIGSILFTTAEVSAKSPRLLSSFGEWERTRLASVHVIVAF